jgi:hypothetical protein
VLQVSISRAAGAPAVLRRLADGCSMVFVAAPSIRDPGPPNADRPGSSDSRIEWIARLGRPWHHIDVVE